MAPVCRKRTHNVCQSVQVNWRSELLGCLSIILLSSTSYTSGMWHPPECIHSTADRREHVNDMASLRVLCFVSAHLHQCIRYYTRDASGILCFFLLISSFRLHLKASVEFRLHLKASKHLKSHCKTDFIIASSGGRTNWKCGCLCSPVIVEDHIVRSMALQSHLRPATKCLAGFRVLWRVAVGPRSGSFQIAL
jgi:hypothetical protein